jgi:uroporphyrinogen decarboxylase
MLVAIRRATPDHVPLYAWVFGFPPAPQWRWDQAGKPVQYWYSGRLEHLHRLPQPWDVAGDFKRVDAWLALGVDDVLDVSIPWSIAPEVTWLDSESPAGREDPQYPVMTREYQTPAGALRHSVRRTGEDPGAGWVVQPPDVPLIEDFNIPRAVRHPVAGPADVEKIQWVYRPPNPAQRAWVKQRMAQVRDFAEQRGVLAQAWSAFGMDAAVWFAGAEGAVMLCMEHPEAFQSLLRTIHETDKARTALALENGADMVCQRGWYSSTDFWSPSIFKQYLKPQIAELAAMAHERGKLFAYVMTTGVMTLGNDLMEAGVDLLYYLDPVQDHVDLAQAKQLFGGKMAVAGGINSSITLGKGTPREIRDAVHAALSVYGRDGGFILSPVDALFPDTPWRNVQIMIEAWKQASS